MQRYTVLIAALLLATGCDNDPGKGKPVATVTQAAPVPENAGVSTTIVGEATAATKYVFSNANSKLTFVAAKVTRKHEGEFHVFTGAVELVKKGMSVGIVEVATGSITADDPKLTSHLKTPDLLDTKRFPKARFISTLVRAGGEGGATHTVTGNLELHGVTRSITFPASVKVTPEGLTASVEVVINRQDFGIVFPGMPDDLIKDHVLIRADIHAVQMPR